MQLIKNLSRSKVLRIVGLALVLATVISFQKPVSADTGSGDRNLLVRVFSGDPINDQRISGATIHINGGPDNGLVGTTDNSGTFTFHVHEGDFAVSISHPDFYTADFPVSMDIGELVLDAPMTPKAIPTPTPTPTPSPVTPTGCTPTPPRGRPMLNIWPIANNGSDCTDYSLIAAENVSAGTSYTTGTVNANPGDTIRVRMYVHNGVLDFPENEAINVNLKANVPTSQGSATITAEAWADNADRISSGQKGGSPTINMSGNGFLSYVSGSAKLYDRGPSNVRGFSDSVVTSGASVGNMRGCFPFLHFVTFELKVNAPAVVPPPVTPPVTPPTPPSTPPPPPPAPGTISLTKNVRNVTAGQTAFTNSTAASPTDQVEFQMKVSASSGNVNNVSFSDSLPSRLVYVNNSLTVDGAPSGNNLSNLSLGNFSSGQTKTVVIRATTSDASQFSVGSTTLTNVSSVTSDSNSNSASANVIVNIAPSNVNLNLTKLARNITQNQTVFTKSIAANPSDLVQFQIQLTTTAGTSAKNVVVTDNLPNNLSFISGSSATTNLGDITNSTLLLTAVVGPESSFNCGSVSLTNTASATASNANSVSDSATVIVTRNNNCGGGGSASLSINKTVRDLTQNQSVYTDSISANPGDQVQFQIQITSTGSLAAQNVNMNDSLPSNLNLISGNLNQNLGTISSGSTQTVLITASVQNVNTCGTTSVVNTASATASNTNSASDTATVFINGNNCGGGGSAALSLTKEVRNVSTGTSFSNFTNASNNDRVEFRLIVRNTGNITANNVRLSDGLPSGLTYIPGTFTIDFGSASGNLFFGNTEFLGNLFAGQTRTISFQATVNSNQNQTLTNTATATADNTNSANAQANVFVATSGNINLVLSKRAFNQTQNIDATSVTAKANDIIVYTLRAQNQGTVAATNFVFVDNMSDVLQLSRMNNLGDSLFDSGILTLRWAPVTIPAGGYVEKTFSVVVNSTNPVGDNVMTNTYGNTININVGKVSGVFVAPPTGSAGLITLSIILALSAVAAVVAIRNPNIAAFIKTLILKNNTNV